VVTKSRRGQDPADIDDLSELRAAAAECTRCELYRDATQTVFGDGSSDASLVLVGEQPGDTATDDVKRPAPRGCRPFVCAGTRDSVC
jgi:hypothetical protein